jgi:hypothetical protein
MRQWAKRSQGVRTPAGAGRCGTVCGQVCQTESMIGRRIAAAFPVLLAHAFLMYWLLVIPAPPDRSAGWPEPVTLPITLFPDPLPEPEAASVPEKAGQSRESAPAPAVSESTSLTAPPSVPAVRGRVDWPIEGRKAAARVLAREAESERIARMFAGPDGTWASLTKRERSRLRRFRWKPGVDGLEYDSDGNAIYHISEGCVIVNSGFIGCAIGKAKVHGDLFKDMRLYFDEQRLPPTIEGNGTEYP